MPRSTTPAVALLALLATAVAGGAAAALVTACFIRAVKLGTELLWTHAPDWIGVDPYDSWWLFAVPVAGGALVGLGQRYLGNHPEPLARIVQRWRSGDQVDPRTVPATAINSLVALSAGGPVGFEAALTGLLGGCAAWVGTRIRGVGHMLREAAGDERFANLPSQVRTLPYWVAAVSGLLTYRWLPFGEIDFGFRLGAFDGELSVGEAAVVLGFAMLVAIPVAWAAATAIGLEEKLIFRRSPVLIGMAGGLLFAALAAGNHLVLFSGQQGIHQLAALGTGQLAYLAVAKWLALCIALAAGWRGGPVFPLFFSVAAVAALAAGVVDVPLDLITAAGIAAVSVVLVRGNVPVGFVVSLYVVPFSYTAPILVACVGAAMVLVAAAAVGAVPRRE